MQAPPTAKQPPYGRLMPARVEVAVDEAYVKETGPAKEVEAALVKETTPEKVSLFVKVEVAVRKPESLVNWEVASFCQKAEVPFVVKTVEEAPVAERPVPPLAIVRSLVRFRVFIEAVPVAVRPAIARLPENRPLPWIESVEAGDVVPIPRLVELTVRVGIALYPTMKLFAVLFVNPEPKAVERAFVAETLLPKANEASPEDVIGPFEASPPAKAPP